MGEYCPDSLTFTKGVDMPRKPKIGLLKAGRARARVAKYLQCHAKIAADQARFEFNYPKSMPDAEVIRMADQIIKNTNYQKRKKLSTSQIKEKRSIGDKFYKSREWRQLRYIALKNCGAKCQICGAPGKEVRLHVDHIKPIARYPELRASIDNLQVICEDCNIGKGAWDETDYRS